MQTKTVFLFLLALLIAFLFVYFQYFYKEKRHTSSFILAILRFLSVFSILLLLINPKFIKNNFETIKPRLLVAVDNSSSINFGNKDSTVTTFVDQLLQSEKLNNKFELSYFTFGSVLQNSSNFTFQDNQTNIYSAIKDLNELSKREIAPILLISDGNQTFGNEYRYYTSNQVIYPIIIGDTIQFPDLEISRINVNSYTYLENNFPVEIFVRYSGNENITTDLTVVENEQIVYSKNITLSKNKNTERLQINLPSKSIGKHLYRVYITELNNEKNKINNTYNFTIEVIDEQTKIALIYDILHPDIGMIKRTIEGSKQRKIELININNLIKDSLDHNVFILYQPNNKFVNILKEIEKDSKNYLIITGNHTNWNFLNNAQNNFKKTVSENSENYYPVFQKNFNTFFVEDIGFSDFPPLVSAFGKIEFYVPYQALLTQSINGIITEDPLLVTFSDKNKRGVVLFGENIWKWRAINYSYHQSFEKFDQFFNSMIQYLTIANKDNQIELYHNSFYYANEPIIIKAKSYDSNLNFDRNAQLELHIDKHDKNIAFYLKDNYYEVQLIDFDEGNYNFTVANKQNDKKQSGTFNVGKYSVEQELLQANSKDLEAIAENSKGKSFYPSQFNELSELLLINQEFVSIQKENKKIISLIDWKWLLGVIILSLSLEWFIRKYRGLI